MRPGLIILVALLTALPGRGQEAAADPAVPAVARPLLRASAPVGLPFPFVLELRSPDGGLDGYIETWTGPGEQPCRLRQDLRTGGGRFRFHLYPNRTDRADTRVEWRLHGRDGRQLAAGQLPLPADNQAEQRRILARLDQDVQLSAPALDTGATTALLLWNLLRDSRLMPDAWYGYLSVDTVLWDGALNAPADAFQRRALADWVRAGGRLVLLPRAGANTLPSPCPELFADLQLRWEDGRARAEGFAADPDGDLARVRHGLGEVLLLRRDARRLPELPPAALAAIFDLPRPLPEPADSTAAGGWFDPRDQAPPIGALQDWLLRAAGYVALDFSPILLFGLIYILAIAVLDRLVLRRLRRLHWTWVTFPATIGVFTVLAYLLFYRGDLGESRRQELVFRDRDAEGRVERQWRFGCVRQRDRGQVRFEAPPASWWAPWPGDDFHGGGVAGSLHEHTRLQPPKLITLPGVPGSFSAYRSLALTVDPPPAFDVQLRWGRGRLEGQVTPRSGPPPRDAFLVFGDYIYYLRPAADGRLEIAGIDPLAEAAAAFHSGTGAARGHEELWDWCRRNVAATATTAGDGADPRGPAALHRRLDPHTGILFAFHTEADPLADPPATRAVCIRQCFRIDTP